MAKDQKGPDRETAAADDGELSDEQLESVSGGGITDGTSNTLNVGDGSVFKAKIQGLFHSY